MAFQAGQKVRASEINRGIPTIARATADTTVNNTTTLVNAVGLVVPVEADAHYWWRCLLAFNGNATADIKLAWTVPSGADGFWGSVDESVRVDDYGAAATYTIDGANTVAELSGWLDTSAAAGNLQLQFAQNTATAVNTIVRAGSMLQSIRA